MNWTQQWIDEVLAEIPPGRYRQRLEAELRDHLETQCRALMEAGWTGEAAQAEALGVMGEPEVLREEYRTAWRRTFEAKARAALGYLGAAVGGSLILFEMFVLVTALLLIPAEHGGGVQGELFSNGAFRFLAGSLSFWIPFAVEAAFLRLCLRNYRCRGTLIGLALLLTWVLGTAVFVTLGLEMGEYSQYGLLPPAWPDRLALFYSDMQHSRAPWVTPGYHLMNIGGCVFLGQLFGRIPVRSKKTAAA